MMIAASGLDLYKSRDFLSMADFPMFAVGFVTAFVVAMVAIKTFLALIRRLDFIPFAIYRFLGLRRLPGLCGLMGTRQGTRKGPEGPFSCRDTASVAGSPLIAGQP